MLSALLTKPMSGAYTVAMSGAEPLLQAFNDPSIVELIVNDDGSVYAERGGLKLAKLEFKAAPEDVEQFLQRLVGEQKLGPDRAFADLSAPDGSRIHVLARPIVRGAYAVTIRKRPLARPSLDDLARGETLTPACADFLEYAVEQRKNILVVGGTSPRSSMTHD